MTPTIKSLGIDQLPRDVRLALVQEIWDTIAQEADRIPLSKSQQLELERRLADDDANPNDAVSWEGVKARAISRLTK